MIKKRIYIIWLLFILLNGSDPSILENKYNIGCFLGSLTKFFLPQRCLTTMDLTSLGVGSCVGTGMYLVAGMVARKFAGPGVVISFIIAALASIFSGEFLSFYFYNYLSERIVCLMIIIRNWILTSKLIDLIEKANMSKSDNLI